MSKQALANLYSFTKISEDKLINASIKIKANRSAGHDKIAKKLLKAADHPI